MPKPDQRVSELAWPKDMVKGEQGGGQVEVTEGGVSAGEGGEVVLENGGGATSKNYENENVVGFEEGLLGNKYNFRERGVSNKRSRRTEA